MSINITIRLPLHTAAAIQNGDHDKIQLSRYVIDAVNALPLRLNNNAIRPDEMKEASTSYTETETEDEQQLTPPSSIFSRDDPETQTLYSERAASPTPTLRSVVPRYEPSDPPPAATRDDPPPISAPRIDFKEKLLTVLIDQGIKGTWPLPVRNTMTVGDLMVEIELKTGIAIERQRLKLSNGKALEFGLTLEAAAIKSSQKLILTTLVGVCFPDSTLDFWVHVLPGSSVPETRFPVHAKPSTTARELSLALFASHRVPVRQQSLFLGAGVVVFDGREGREALDALGIHGGSTVGLKMVITEAEEMKEQRRFEWVDPPRYVPPGGPLI